MKNTATPKSRLHSALRNEGFIAILMGSDSPFVIREVLLEGDDEGEKSARMVANAPIPIGSEVLLIGGLLSLPLLH